MAPSSKNELNRGEKYPANRYGGYEPTVEQTKIFAQNRKPNVRSRLVETESSGNGHGPQPFSPKSTGGEGQTPKRGTFRWNFARCHAEEKRSAGRRVSGPEKSPEKRSYTANREETDPTKQAIGPKVNSKDLRSKGRIRSSRELAKKVDR